MIQNMFNINLVFRSERLEWWCVWWNRDQELREVRLCGDCDPEEARKLAGEVFEVDESDVRFEGASEGA